MSKKPNRLTRYAVEKIPLHRRITKAYSTKVRRGKAWAKKRKTFQSKENRGTTPNTNTDKTTTSNADTNSSTDANTETEHTTRCTNGNGNEHHRPSYSSVNDGDDGPRRGRPDPYRQTSRPYLVPSSKVFKPSVGTERNPGSKAKLPAILVQELLSRCQKCDSSRTGKIASSSFRLGRIVCTWYHD